MHGSLANCRSGSQVTRNRQLAFPGSFNLGMCIALEATVEPRVTCSEWLQSARNYRASSANFTQDIEIVCQDNVDGRILRLDCRFMRGYKR